MKVKQKNIVVTVLIFVTLLFVVGCNNKGGQQKDLTPTTTPELETHKVTFYDQDGTTELSSVDIEDGELVKEFIPEKEAFLFMGWYATPSLSHKFDFKQPIKEETEIFAGFLESKDDTRSFIIVGSGKSPVLLSSNWGKEVKDEHMLMKADDSNVYEITLDLLEGDEFQFAIDSSWNNQRGAGYMTETSIDGEEYFINSGGTYSDDTKKSNIKCAKDGNYTITLTTYPGADFYNEEDEFYTEDNREAFNMNPYDTITWTYNGEAESVGNVDKDAEDLKVTYYIKGAKVTGWEDMYDESYKFEELEGIHFLKIDLEEEDEFLFTSLLGQGDEAVIGTEYVRFSNIQDETSLTYVEGNSSHNIISKSAGTYTFTYNPSIEELIVDFEAK